jgi:mannose-6-phosphate isomerase-like protein (cupin superfamily)
MALKPGEDIGEEVHADRDQFFRVEKGTGGDPDRR